ncbi:6-pyruvoyl-tetrahydropterin synthase related domain membrane protein [Rhodospirillales bacterium URHD0017]|nr:6-pyruvoyl-tetrahydropterin synthase related domain membrane protein [Rhodospirillales bacterium URHD0017]
MRHPALVLAAAAILLLSPTLVLGTLISHSSPQNLTWASQFADQFRAGILYPRWMPDSFDGLGSPAFYFYPPLPFWTDAVVSVITANALSVSYCLAVSTTVILFLSGLAMRAWLLRVSGRRTAALVGAVAYMAAPYHLFDTYTRGAFAEITGYAVLPVVMLALRLTIDRARWGLPLLASAYAALLLSHLPTALLCSITIIPAYVLFTTRARALLLRCAAGGVLGIGLAAIYLVPAMELQSWISAHELWTSFYRASNWFVMAPERWVDPDTMRVIGSIVLAAALLAAGLCLALLQLPDGDGRRELGFWVALSLACLILIAGLLPWFWDLPLVGKVQFPWRLLMVVEFSLLTALCLTPLAEVRRGVVYVLAAAGVALVPGAVLIVTDVRARAEFVARTGTLDRHDVKEYQPAGYKFAGARYADLGLEQLKDAPVISCAPAARTCHADNEPFGNLRLAVTADQPTTVTLRRFFFPAWRLDGRLEAGLPLAASEPLRLVSFTAPAGETVTRLDRGTLAIERWGQAISGLSLLLLLALVIRSTARG